MHFGRIQSTALLCGLATAALAACGSRGLLEEGTGGVENLAETRASEEAGARGPDGGLEPRDGGSPFDAGCAGLIASCVSSSACARVMGCVVVQCANATGASQVTCALGCSGGDFQQLTAMMPLFTCLQGMSGVLGTFGGGPAPATGAGAGGLGGLLGGGGLGGLVGDGGLGLPRTLPDGGRGGLGG